MDYKRTALWVIAMAVLLAALLSGPVNGAPQDAAKPALTLDNLKDLLTVGASDTRLRQLVNQQKVDFEVTSGVEADLRKIGASPELIDLMRIKRYTPSAGLNIACKPTDCQIMLNGSSLGQSVDGKFETQGLPPGKVKLEAAAPGYSTSTADLELIDGQVGTYIFTLMLSSPAAVPTDPSPAAIAKGRPDPPVNPAAAPSESVVQPTANDVPAAAAQEILAKIIDGLGGSGPLKDITKYLATGTLTLVSGRATLPPTEAQLEETVLYPGRIRWELRIAGARWSVVNDGAEVSADGDSKYKGSELGQELEKNIQKLLPLHIVPLLQKLQVTRITHFEGSSSGDTQVLKAVSEDDQYTLFYDASYRISKVLHQPVTGLQSVTAVSYGRYTKVGDATLPFLVTLEYPSQKGYGQEIRYTKIDPAAPVKDSDFKKKGIINKLIPIPGKP